MRGTVDAPQLLADITARALRWQELTIAQVNVKGDVKSTDQIGGNLDVRVDRISQPGVNISQVQLNAKGTEKQHELRLRVQGDPVSGQLTLAGGFDRQAETLEGLAERYPLPDAGGAGSADAQHCAGLSQSGAENQHRATLLDQPERRALRA